MFEVSDKVVCIDDGPGNGKNKYLGKPLPIHKGVIYVVRGTAISCTGIPMLYLVGINMDISPITGREYGFRACRFRKLSEIKAENAERAKKEEILRKAFFSSTLNPWVDNNQLFSGSSRRVRLTRLCTGSTPPAECVTAWRDSPNSPPSLNRPNQSLAPDEGRNPATFNHQGQ